MPIGKPTAAYDEDEVARVQSRVLLGGTRPFRAQCEQFLPANPGEKYLPPETDPPRTSYAIRVARSVLYPLYKRAISKAVGAILRKPVALQDDVPSAVEALWEDIDRRGNNGDIFLRDVLRDGLGEAGVSFILVDHTPVTGDSRADLKPSDRPYWVHVRARDLLNPDNWIMVDGVPRPKVWQVEECTTEAKDEYTPKSVKRIRVLRRAGEPDANGVTHAVAVAELWQKDESKADQPESWILASSGGPFEMTPHVEIPIVPLYFGKSGEFRGCSPFDDVGFACICHGQKLSDKDWTLWRISAPLIHRAGCTKDEAQKQFLVASGAVWWSESPEAKAEWLEHSGQVLASSAEDLRALAEQIAIWSMEPHVKRVGDETATGKLIDYEQAQTEIEAWGLAVKDAIEQALKLTAMYLGEASGGSVEVPSAKRDDQRDIAKLTLARELAVDFGLPAEVVLAEFKKAGVFSEDFDIGAAVAAAEEALKAGAEGDRLAFARRVVERVATGVDLETALDHAAASSLPAAEDREAT